MRDLEAYFPCRGRLTRSLRIQYTTFRLDRSIRKKIETDFFAGRLPPSRDREAAADTFCSPCTYPEGETSGPGGLPDRRLVRMAGPDRGVIDQWLIPTGSCWRA